MASLAELLNMNWQEKSDWIERKFEGKDKPICYDLVDPIQYFIKMYSDRKRYYKRNNNEIKEG